DVRDRPAVHRGQRCILRRSLPGGLHPLHRRRGAVFHQPRRVHRLRRLRRGLPRRGDLLRRRPAGAVGRVPRQEQGALPV
ncbi:MAG: Ferredoxin, partial [uncultured Thermomicrobiales bacterium]